MLALIENRRALWVEIDLGQIFDLPLEIVDYGGSLDWPQEIENPSAWVYAAGSFSEQIKMNHRSRQHRLPCALPSANPFWQVTVRAGPYEKNRFCGVLR